ncbi:MAG: hypothetical protein EA422_01285 [Gemmatimonadales bacterium]|nr:MAG: hypothetical protein EA422_01285 [Gemmatimonadales bacterium]
MWNRIRRTSGSLGARLVLVLVSLTLLGGCNYTFQAGAGLPSHVRSVAIVPFDNETSRFELTQEIHEVLLQELPQQFGVRTGSEEFAEAIVRGRIRNYSVDAPSYRQAPDGRGAEVLERQVSMTVEIEIIDRVNNMILWDNSNLSVRGEYLEASELEEDGRRLAIQRLLQNVVDGVQSNW